MTNIDPRVFQFLYSVLEEPQEQKASKKSDHGNKIILPIEMTFRWTWKGMDNEHYEIRALLLYVDLERRVMFHYVYPHSQYGEAGEHFSGRYFANLSSSALHLHPVETNGFKTWFFRENGSFHEMDVARQRGFVNFLNKRPTSGFVFSNSDLPPVSLERSLTKTALTLKANMTREVHWDIGTPSSNKQSHNRRKLQQHIVAPETIVASTQSLSQQWQIEHSVKVVLDYMVEIFPGHSEDIKINEEIITTVIQQESIEKSLQDHIISQTPFNMLGCFMLWHMLYKNPIIPAITIQTDCSDVLTKLKSRTLPHYNQIVAYSVLAGFKNRTYLKFYSFQITTQELIVYRETKEEEYAHIPIQNMLAEIAHVRSASTYDTLKSYMSDTLPLFHRIINVF